MNSTDTTRRNNHAAKKRYQLVQALARKWILKNRPEVLAKLERQARKRYPHVVAVAGMQLQIDKEEGGRDG